MPEEPLGLPGIEEEDIPRFYFVSDSTLLEILSHGSNPRAVQRHFQPACSTASTG